MKSMTLEEFKRFSPCWLESPEGREKLESIGRRKERWTAVDILDLPEDEVSAEDKIWAVTQTGLIEDEKLHEFYYSGLCRRRPAQAGQVRGCGEHRQQTTESIPVCRNLRETGTVWWDSLCGKCFQRRRLQWQNTAGRTGGTVTGNRGYIWRL